MKNPNVRASHKTGKKVTSTQLRKTPESPVRETPAHPEVPQGTTELVELGRLIGELKPCLCQSDALNALLIHHVITPDDSGEYNERIKLGIVELKMETSNRMHSMFHALEHKFQSLNRVWPS